MYWIKSNSNKLKSNSYNACNRDRTIIPGIPTISISNWFKYEPKDKISYIKSNEVGIIIHCILRSCNHNHNEVDPHVTHIEKYNIYKLLSSKKCCKVIRLSNRFASEIAIIHCVIG